MATPKGMRAIQLEVNAMDAIHVYSNGQHVWLQLRRKVLTEEDIGSPLFKTAICIDTKTAEKLGMELLKIADGNKGKQRAKSKQAATKSTGKTK